MNLPKVKYLVRVYFPENPESYAYHIGHSVNASYAEEAINIVHLRLAGSKLKYVIVAAAPEADLKLPAAPEAS